jgi:hypothetical protein
MATNNRSFQFGKLYAALQPGYVAKSFERLALAFYEILPKMPSECQFNLNPDVKEATLSRSEFERDRMRRTVADVLDVRCLPMIEGS